MEDSESTAARQSNSVAKDPLEDTPGWGQATVEAAPLATASRALLLWLCLLTALRFGPSSLNELFHGLVNRPRLKAAEYTFLIDINTADMAELQSLEGIGPALAGRIIEYRTEHGPYRAVEELLKVKGFGEKRLQQLAPWLSVAPASRRSH